MLSLTSNFLHSPFLSSSFPLKPNKLVRKPISATFSPSSSSKPPKKLYQPFRKPPSKSPIPPQYQNLDTNARLDVLANRLGLWHEYASLITPLIEQGLDPTNIEEYTTISVDEQNRLVVAAKVRDTLVQVNVDEETLEYFDKGGGAELLYEIRLVSVDQRAAAVKYLTDNKFGQYDCQELARAIKDFPRRRADRGWDCFDQSLPADCLAFMYYRQALEEVRELELRILALEKALSVAESEEARAWISKDLDENVGAREAQEAGDEAV